MSTPPKRSYVSESRESAAKMTRARVLAAAKALFAARGIEDVRLSEIAAAADVSPSTLYAVFKSREGILRDLLKAALFGPHYQAALACLKDETDPVRLIALTASVARAIWDAEKEELGLVRQLAAYSPTLREMDREFEAMRFSLQETRIVALFDAGLSRPDLDLMRARRLMWMYTTREIYAKLVTDGGWTSDEYEDWLRETLMAALVSPEARPA